MSRGRLHIKCLCLAGGLLALIVIMSGCGGSMGSAIMPSPFAGQWTGAWSNSANGQNGTMNVTIGTNGTLTGTVNNATQQAPGTVDGTVRSTGQMNVTLRYPDTNYSASGNVIKDSSGHLVGTLQITVDNAVTGALTLALQKQ